MFGACAARAGLCAARAHWTARAYDVSYALMYISSDCKQILQIQEPFLVKFANFNLTDLVIELKQTNSRNSLMKGRNPFEFGLI